MPRQSHQAIRSVDIAGDRWHIAVMALSESLFELRTYVPGPGKLEALEARFRDHTIGFFTRHGIEVIGFWRAEDPADLRLFYLLRFPSRAAADVSWEGFHHDPEWIALKEETDAGGALAAVSDSLFLKATEYSPMT